MQAKRGLYSPPMCDIGHLGGSPCPGKAWLLALLQHAPGQRAEVMDDRGALPAAAALRVAHELMESHDPRRGFHAGAGLCPFSALNQLR